MAKTPDIQVGDVWKSAKGGRLVTVVPKSLFRGYGATRDSRDVAYRGVTGAVMIALAANFMRGRSLHERNGVRVGDVRAIGAASTVKVLHIREDGATCENPTGNEWLLLSYLAALPLVSRNGKTV